MPSHIEQIIKKLTNVTSTPTHLKFPCNKNVLANQKSLQCAIHGHTLNVMEHLLNYIPK